MGVSKKGRRPDGAPVPMFMNPKKTKKKKEARAANNMEQMCQMAATQVDEIVIPPDEPIQEIAVPDPSAEACELLLEETDFMYQLFKLFLFTDCTSSVTWPDDIRSPANAFVEMAEKIIPACAVKSRADFILGLIPLLGQAHKTRLFVTLWKMFRAENPKELA
ncbi:hypothetical protein AK830_g10872 [Neonectria ditissima]|uniref:Uncharacterized protein n=1 Tax=Neonectria ditissima TaxID=78410 RepID=A0A0P7B4U0_9HYPO|nr:hypothetical protein AK830_g10872 [Neonectria ditissima]